MVPTEYMLTVLTGCISFCTRNALSINQMNRRNKCGVFWVGLFFSSSVLSSTAFKCDSPVSYWSSPFIVSTYTDIYTMYVVYTHILWTMHGRIFNGRVFQSFLFIKMICFPLLSSTGLVDPPNCRWRNAQACCMLFFHLLVFVQRSVHNCFR